MPKVTSYPRHAPIGAVVFMAFAFSGVVGCATCPHARRTAVVRPRNQNLIFNPEWTALAVFEPGRSEWPAVIASEMPSEAVDYQEIIHDLQGRTGFWNDNYYRQFDSVRFGHARR